MLRRCLHARSRSAGPGSVLVLLDELPVSRISEFAAADVIAPDTARVLQLGEHRVGTETVVRWPHRAKSDWEAHAGTSDTTRRTQSRRRQERRVRP